MALAWRTPAYGGAMAARLESEMPGAGSGRERGAQGRTAQAKDVPLGSAGTIGSDADGLPLGDLFEIG